MNFCQRYIILGHYKEKESYNIDKKYTMERYYKTTKDSKIYECQLYEPIRDFKDGIRFDKNKVFKKLKKVSDYGMGGSR